MAFCVSLLALHIIINTYSFFRVLELQAFIAEMVASFQFDLSFDPKLLRREATSIMAPVIIGEDEKGAQLPMLIKRLAVQDE